MSSGLTREQAEEAIALVNEYLRRGYRPRGVSGTGDAAISAAASEWSRNTGGSPKAFKTRLETADDRFNMAPDWSLYAPAKPRVRVKAGTASQDPATIAEEAIATARMKAEITRLRAENKALATAAAANDDMRKSVFDMVGEPVRDLPWHSMQSSSLAHELTPVLMISDWQWGEVVNLDEMDGINEFNMHIAAERAEMLFRKTVELSFTHSAHHDYPGIVVPIMGDMISGQIHEELAETNDLRSAPAVRDVVRHIKAGLRLLADNFGRVRVYFVAGNHDRDTRKIRAKGYSDASYGSIIGWWLESEFSDDPRIEWVQPPSGDATIQIYGWRFAVVHGDRMGARGGEGFIGPAAVIAKGHQKVIRQYSRLGRRIDWVLHGHFHTTMELPFGIANGALVGYNEYARSILRADPEAAQQTLFFVHKEHGICLKRNIHVSQRPRLGEFTSSEIAA